jgi:hypothetical protein
VVMIGSSLTVLHQLCHCILVTVMMLLLSLMEVIVHYVYTSVPKLCSYSLSFLIAACHSSSHSMITHGYCEQW